MTLLCHLIDYRHVYLGRRFIGFEIEPKYVDMANERARPHLERKQLSIIDFLHHD